METFSITKAMLVLFFLISSCFVQRQDVNWSEEGAAGIGTSGSEAVEKSGLTIEKVYGDGATSGTFQSALIVEGKSFTADCEAQLEVKAGSTIRTLAVAFVSAEKLTLFIPAETTEGDYVLSIFNSAGGDSTEVTLLKGDKGDKGDTGEQGKDGLDGKSGTNGEDGTDGQNAACLGNTTPQLGNITVTDNTSLSGTYTITIPVSNSGDSSQKNLSYEIYGGGGYFYNNGGEPRQYIFDPMKSGYFTNTVLLSDQCGVSLNHFDIEVEKGWRLAGEKEFLSIDYSKAPASMQVFEGAPYIAYQNTIDGKAWVIRRVNNNWQHLGEAVSEGTADNISLFIDNGTPYVSYRDIYSGRAKVKRFINSWQTVGTNNISSGTADQISLFVENGLPYVAFREIDINGYYIIKGMKIINNEWKAIVRTTMQNCSGNNCEEEVPVSNPYFEYLPYSVSIFVSNGTPFISYINYWDYFYNYYNNPVVKKASNTTWEIVGSNNLNFDEYYYDSVSELVLFVENGVPYVAYVVQGYDGWINSYYSGYVVKKLNNGLWTNISSDIAYNFNPFSNISMSVSKGTPYVVYQEQVKSPINSEMPEYEYVTKVKRIDSFFSTDLELNAPGFNIDLTGSPMLIKASLSLYKGIPYVAYAESFINGASTISVKKYLE